MEEMVFTKEFRNVIYKRTLVEYESSIKERNNFGFCYAVRCVLLQMIDENLIQKDEDPEQDGISKKLTLIFHWDSTLNFWIVNQLLRMMVYSGFLLIIYGLLKDELKSLIKS